MIQQIFINLHSLSIAEINNFVDDFANDLILIKFSTDSIDQLSQNKGEKPPQNTQYLLDLESVEAPGNISALLSV